MWCLVKFLWLLLCGDRIRFFLDFLLFLLLLCLDLFRLLEVLIVVLDVKRIFFCEFFWFFLRFRGEVMLFLDIWLLWIYICEEFLV